MTYKEPKYYSRYRFMRAVTTCPNHPDYHLYGAQGIECYWPARQYYEFERWLLTTLGPPPSSKHVLGRKDKSGNFEPRNLEWQEPVLRSRNKTRQNVYATYRRQRKALSQWAEELAIPYHTFRRRIAQGKTISEIKKEFYAKQ